MPDEVLLHDAPELGALLPRSCGVFDEARPALAPSFFQYLFQQQFFYFFSHAELPHFDILFAANGLDLFVVVLFVAALFVIVLFGLLFGCDFVLCLRSEFLLTAALRGFLLAWRAHGRVRIRLH